MNSVTTWVITLGLSVQPPLETTAQLETTPQLEGGVSDNSLSRRGAGASVQNCSRHGNDHDRQRRLGQTRGQRGVPRRAPPCGTGHRVELGRYAVGGGEERILYGQRVDGVVRFLPEEPVVLDPAAGPASTAGVVLVSGSKRTEARGSAAGRRRSRRERSRRRSLEAAWHPRDELPAIVSRCVVVQLAAA